MTMPKDTKYEQSQLTTRHWIIMKGDVKEEVQGEGVIGMYPIMKAGSYFDYESCCNVIEKGSMKGEFQMISSTTKQRFNIIVPEFYFEATGKIEKLSEPHFKF